MVIAQWNIEGTGSGYMHVQYAHFHQVFMVMHNGMIKN